MNFVWDTPIYYAGEQVRSGQKKNTKKWANG